MEAVELSNGEINQNPNTTTTTHNDSCGALKADGNIKKSRCWFAVVIQFFVELRSSFVKIITTMTCGVMMEIHSMILMRNGIYIRSDLDREWHRRYNEFHTIGYRDGLIAGKEVAAQEGFNIGFKQSVLVGFKWGLVRSVTSVLACLQNDVKEKLVGTLEIKEKLQTLHESVHSVSAKDALSFYNDEILADQTEEHCKYVKRNSAVESMPDKISICGQLGKYYEELESLLECSAIKMPSPMGRP